MQRVAAVILGGGRGERLKPLTNKRAKPAVPFAGMYRLVDIPISNCLHAGIDRIYVLTQYRAMSLNRHVAQAYRFDAFSEGHVTVMAAEQTAQGDLGDDWYHGTADAVRKQFPRIDVEDDGDVIVLSGDQVYRMPMDGFVNNHRKSGADITIAATRVSATDARRFGVMRVDVEHRVTEFAEKPQDLEVIRKFAAPDAHDERTHLGSMGIYVFKKHVLANLLASADIDFGKHVLPRALADGLKLSAFPFDGFWEDVGTISSLHRVNLQLTEPIPDFNLFLEQSRLYTRQRFLPPAKIGNAVVQRALIAGGAIIGDGATVQQSVVGIRTVVGPRCVLDRVVCNGAGTYDFSRKDSKVPLGIGEDSVLRNVLLDLDARVGRGVHLVNRKGLETYQDEHIVVRDGIIVVPSQAEIPDGYTF